MNGPPRPLALLVLVSTAAAAAYIAATLGHGFVYDDHRFVEGNPGMDAVASAPWRAFDPRTASLDGAEPGMWRPLRTLSFVLDRALLGPGPAGMHFSSALLHGLAAALVFATGMSLGLGDMASAAGAAIFGFHPVQAESVAWISSRGDLLAAVLLLAATTAHLRRARPVLVAALVGFAFLAKEAALAAPLLLAAADLAAGGWARLRERRRSYVAAAAGLAALVGIRALALASVEAPFGQGGGAGFGPLHALAALPSAFAWYAGRLLIPRPGTFDFQLEPSALLAMAGLAGAAVLASWERLRLPARAAAPLRCAALWALAVLAPVTLLQLLFPLKILVADRFLYLALAGPALAAGAVAASSGPRALRGLLVASPLLLVATLPASARWSSDESLWQDTLDRDPLHPRALYGLAFAREASSPEEAVGLYGAYTEAVPGDPGAWFRLGMTEFRLSSEAADAPARTGHSMLAVHALGEAVRIWLGGEREGRARGLTEARLARAAVLANLGKEEPAVAEAVEGYRLWLAEPADRQEALRPRVDALRAWARQGKDREGTLAVLEGRAALPPVPLPVAEDPR